MRAVQQWSHRRFLRRLLLEEQQGCWRYCREVLPRRPLLHAVDERSLLGALDHGFYVQLFGGENLLAPKIRERLEVRHSFCLRGGAGLAFALPSAATQNLSHGIR